jgi:hypothetical protein
MKQFNYAQAWAELACVDYDCLPMNVRHLVSITIQASQNLVQGQNLDMPWPSEEDLCVLLAAGEIDGEVFDAGLHLREMFEKTSDEDLAFAAQVVYSYGHWAPGKVEDQPFAQRLTEHLGRANRFQKTGGYWKFANYADQELTRRIGIARNRTAAEHGITWAVHEGCLRICWSHPRGWTWTEVGWATQQVFERLNAIAKPQKLTRLRGRNLCTERDAYNKWDAYVAKLKATNQDERFERWTNLESYMEEA